MGNLTISMQSFQCLRLLVLVVLVVTAAHATGGRRRSTPTGHPYTSTARAHWKQCVSEGGTKNCAQCSGTDSGSLNCAAPSCDNNDCSKDCPEYITSGPKGPRFFQVKTNGKGTCNTFSDHKRETPAPFNGWEINHLTGKGCRGITDACGENKGKQMSGADGLLPGCDGTLDGPHVISKATMEHPSYADKNIVALVHKRLVMHPDTTTNVMVADVFKVGLCVKCQTDVVHNSPRTLLGEESHCSRKKTTASKAQCLAAVVKKEDLYKDNGCLMKAFDSDTGELKPEYRCDNSTESYGHYQSFLAAF